MTLDKQILDNVRRQVQRCCENMVSGSGHLCSCAIVADLFEVTSVTELGDGQIAYAFTTQVYRESEFYVAEEGVDPPTDSLSGKIVLDAEFQLVFDDANQVRISPWRCAISP